MKRFFSLLALISMFSIFIFNQPVKAQDASCAKVILHYHRYEQNYDQYELYVWDHDNTGESQKIDSIAFDTFGRVYEISICDTAQQKIGIILSEKETMDRDGIDVNMDGDIDNRYIDVSDLIGTANTKHVYLMQGASEVYYQDNTKPTYFGKPDHGNVVVVYYNSEGNDGWNDFQIWSHDNTISDTITYDYELGISGQMNPSLFKVAVMNIPCDADDQLGFVVRKNNTWDIKDTLWKLELASNETDVNGNTYTTTGDRFINVTDVKGSGFKFIYVINGVKTIFEDYQTFIDEAFKIDFTEAKFETSKTLTITFNQDINYDVTGPDMNQFVVTDELGNMIPIERIAYNSQSTSDHTFDIILQKNIEKDKTYVITYQSNITTTPVQSIITNNIDKDQDKEDEKTNYTPYIIGGITLITFVGAGYVLLYGRKR